MTYLPRFTHVRMLVLLSAAVVAAAATTPPPAAAASSNGATAHDAAGKDGRRGSRVKRQGGKVRAAWPARGEGGRPRKPVARWLARQVGPKEPVERRRRPTSKRPRASMAAPATSPGGAQEKVSFDAVKKAEPLALIRSYEIPTDDPAYERLLNLSWTYDSAVSAVAFVNLGDRTQAERLLDQLMALQRTDGSLDFAYDTSTGAGAEVFRTGSVAWVGLAASVYRERYNSARYKKLAEGAAAWLRAREVTASTDEARGLLRGGPDVPWVSTQHNLVAYFFLSHLADRGKGPKEAGSAAERIGAGLDRYALVQGASPYFRQGIRDDVRALDVQALGILWLVARGRAAEAAAVRASTEQAFAISGRSITRSTSSSTFNNTYSASGPFVGYRPYAGPSTPDVLWMEGTAQMRFVRFMFSDSVTALDSSGRAWTAVTSARSQGLLGADRTVTDSALNEYHVWPTASASAWSLISGSSTFLGSLLG